MTHFGARKQVEWCFIFNKTESGWSSDQSRQIFTILRMNFVQIQISKIWPLPFIQVLPTFEAIHLDCQSKASKSVDVPLVKNGLPSIN